MQLYKYNYDFLIYNFSLYNPNIHIFLFLKLHKKNYAILILYFSLYSPIYIYIFFKCINSYGIILEIFTQGEHL